MILLESPYPISACIVLASVEGAPIDQLEVVMPEKETKKKITNI